jgi:signal transduction histidine kinase/CheY-like chemotaxis protein
VVFDDEGCAIVDANRNAELLFHATREQLLAADPWDLSPPTQPDGSPSVETGRRIFAKLGEGAQSFDWTHRTLDGQPLATRVWFSREERRSRHQVRLAILDLREIERANLELSRHRRFLEQTQALARVGGWELDLPQRRVVWTAETARLFGRDPAQPTPSFEESNALYAPEYRDELHEAVTRATTTGAPFRIEPEILAADGRRRRVRISGVAELRDGTPQRVFGAIQDVTEERLLEEQLRHASQMDAVGQLAAGVAHDFNNMLGAIVAAAEALKLDRLGANSTESVDTILSAATQAASLTRQLLLFSRKERPRREPADLHRIVSEATTMLQRTLERRIIVETRLEAAHTQLSADASQLTNALVNLAVNARDAIPGGGRLTFRTSDDGPGQVRLEVSDTGVGIAADVLPHLFEPFFTTKDRGRGTGLGLAAVFTAVKDHGGTISVRSTVGAGATFTLNLPLALEPVGVAPVHAPLVKTWPGQTVLVVDDEDLVRRSMRRLLVRLGFTVLEAPDGASALERFRATSPRPNLVVLDVMMPGAPALEVMKRLREDSPTLPVVFCSGYAPDAVLQALGAEPLAARLSKPFSMDQLREVIEGVLPSTPQR